MKLKLMMAVGTAVGALAVASSAGAATEVVTVDSHAGPWSPLLNPTLDYGVHDNNGPTTVVSTSTSPFDFSAGGSFTITYDSGTVSAGVGFPSTDANGNTGYNASGNLGSSGTYFPSRYISASQYPAYLMALIGTFANASGVVVGTPFLVGDGPFTVAAPSGASELLLGVNDDIFYDNTGSFQVTVSGPSLARAGVPEPATWAMMLLGLLGLGIGLRARPRPRIA